MSGALLQCGGQPRFAVVGAVRVGWVWCLGWPNTRFQRTGRAARYARSGATGPPLNLAVGQPADSSQRSTVTTQQEFISRKEELLWHPKS